MASMMTKQAPLRILSKPSIVGQAASIAKSMGRQAAEMPANTR